MQQQDAVRIALPQQPVHRSCVMFRISMAQIERIFRQPVIGQEGTERLGGFCAESAEVAVFR